MDDRQLLKEVIEFHQLLSEYSRKAGGQRIQDDVAKLRTELAVKWGRIGDALARIGFPPYLEQFGRRFRIMQLALRESSFGRINYATIRTVLQGLEEAVGALQHRIEEAPAARNRKWGIATGGSAAVTVVLIAWAAGRFQDQIWAGVGRRYFWTRGLIFAGYRPWIIAATLIGTVAGSILANRLHEDGIVNAFRRRPVSSLTYLLLTAFCTAAAIVLAK